MEGGRITDPIKLQSLSLDSSSSAKWLAQNEFVSDTNFELQHRSSWLLVPLLGQKAMWESIINAAVFGAVVFEFISSPFNAIGNSGSPTIRDHQKREPGTAGDIVHE